MTPTLVMWKVGIRAVSDVIHVLAPEDASLDEVVAAAADFAKPERPGLLEIAVVERSRLEFALHPRIAAYSPSDWERMHNVPQTTPQEDSF